jgi:hypothetical protein
VTIKEQAIDQKVLLHKKSISSIGAELWSIYLSLIPEGHADTA